MGIYYSVIAVILIILFHTYSILKTFIFSNSAEEAILTLLDYLKDNIHKNKTPFSLKIGLTRKNIAVDY